jgi:acetyl-CoA C-acetyltransferase
MKDEDIVIVSAARTPVGSFNGTLSSVPAHTLGEVAIRAALERAHVAPADVDEVIMGQVLTAGEGQNPARQAAIAAGIPIEATAWGVNQVCGSGLRAVALGAQQIKTGDADIIVAGGQENMSLSKHVAHLRNGQKMGALELVDSMIKDGLWDAFNGYHMGNTAENVARQWQITREDQDKFATHSQNKAEAARHGQDPQGRDCGRRGRVYPRGRQDRGRGEAPPCLRQGRQRDRRQRIGHQ